MAAGSPASEAAHALPLCPAAAETVRAARAPSRASRRRRRGGRRSSASPRPRPRRRRRARPPPASTTPSLGGGRSTRRLRHSMEARFGYDFSGVASARRARGLGCRGRPRRDRVHGRRGHRVRGFDPGCLDLRGPPPARARARARRAAATVPRRRRLPPRVHPPLGRRVARHLLRHRPRATGPTRSSRRTSTTLTARGKIDGAFDADNKARAIVRKWKAATPGWDLLGRQKGLLIDEMLDGPTLDDDEDAILDLLERCDAG